MNIVQRFHDDLKNYDKSDIQILATSYGLRGGYNDLLWLIAIKHAGKHRKAKMSPEESQRLLERLQAWLQHNLGRAFTIEELRNLKKLKLVNMNLQELPSEIGQLANLTSLDLRGNRLEDLPKEFSNLHNLTELAIHNNRFTNIPQAVVELPKLQGLYADNNDIDELPNDLHRMHTLENLSLQHNKIEEIPFGFIMPLNLEFLDLLHNPIKGGSYRAGQFLKRELDKIRENEEKLYKTMVYGGHGAGLELPPQALEALRRTWPKASK